jgi:hypothetical protein
MHERRCALLSDQAAIIALFRSTGNVPSMPGVFPDTTQKLR